MRIDLEQLRLGFRGRVVVSRREAEAVGDAEHMGVDGDSLRVFERFAHDDVRRLPSNSRQFLKLVDVVGHFSSEIGEQRLRKGDEVFRLRPEEPERMDDVLDVGGGCAGHGLGRSVFLEQEGRDFVHGGVGALRGEHDGYGQLKRRQVIEGAGSLAVLLEHDLLDALGALPLGCQVFSWHMLSP